MLAQDGNVLLTVLIDVPSGLGCCTHQGCALQGLWEVLEKSGFSALRGGKTKVLPVSLLFGARDAPSNLQHLVDPGRRKTTD